jgi:hypothetical protein
VPKILERFEEATIDFIMVDGAHEYEPVMSDIINWWPKLKPEGVMFGDDYELASVKQAVKKSLSTTLAPGLSVNSSSEQTWFTSKNIENVKVFQKLVPGQNTLK